MVTVFSIAMWDIVKKQYIRKALTPSQPTASMVKPVYAPEFMAISIRGQSVAKGPTGWTGFDYDPITGQIILTRQVLRGYKEK